MELGWVAVVLLVAASSAEEELAWWRTATFYEVYPRSFKDSDGDGIGDLKGIIQKADHFKDIGVDAIWLTPIYPSPMVDVGYDISDFTGIDPTFGSMKDFDALLVKCKQLGVKLLLDFVPNHSSDIHPWFQMSVNPSHPLHQEYKDFYVWRNASGTTADGTPIPPNNWVSVFGGSAWKWNDQRKQFYLHHFAVEQPDLNYTNPNVVGNMTNVMNFWVEKGIDGFRVDAVDHIFEDPKFPDEEPWPGVVGPYSDWGQFKHTAMLNQPETFRLLEHWAENLYQRGLEKKKQLAMFLEVYAPIEISMKYYGTGNTSMKIPFNFLLYEIGSRFVQPRQLKKNIDLWMSSMPKNGVPNWVISNHDVMRIPNRFGPEMVDTMNLLTGVLPGVKVVYYGDEIGMENTDVSWNKTADPWATSLGPYDFHNSFRDPARTPMQWDDCLNAGFSTNNTTWLPVNPNYWWLNVAAQRAAPVSHLKVFQAMAKARKDPVLQRGDLKIVVPDRRTLVVIRSYNGSYFTLIANLGMTSVTYTSRGMFSQQGLDMDMTIIAGNINSGYSPGSHFKKGSLSFTLRPKASILLKSGSSRLLHSTVLFLFLYMLMSIVV